MMNKRNIILFLFLLFVSLNMLGNIGSKSYTDYQDKTFVNKSLNISHIEYFFQDSIGRIWAGSYNNGWMMFDGDSFVGKTPILSKHGIHCNMSLSKSKELLGTRCGLFVYNRNTLKTIPVSFFKNDEITGLHRINSSEIIVFCAHRIVLFNYTSLKVRVLSHWTDNRLFQYRHLPDDTFLVLTDKLGLCTMSISHPQLKPIRLDSPSIKDEVFLTMQYEKGILWLGTDKGLWKCNMVTRQAESIHNLSGKTIKTLLKDKDGLLWVGTNAGLYIYNAVNMQWSHYFHSTRNENSILNDCVWNIFEDNAGNKWISVEGGVSFLPHTNAYYQLKWDEVVDSYKGNNIQNILHDSHDRIWLGGTNGLGVMDGASGKSLYFEWNSEYKIPNNTIRDIYEDCHGVIWIGTDGGLAWYDEKAKTFRTCHVVDRKSSRNAVWTYGICEDEDGCMWVASCSGGLFKVRREDMLVTNNEPVFALCNYFSTSNEFPIKYDGCLNVIADKKGKLWINADRYIYRIDNSKNIYEQKLTTFYLSNCIDLLCDEKNDIWALQRNKIIKINSVTGRNVIFDLSNYVMEHGYINSFTSSQNYIWILANNDLSVCNKQTHKLRHVLDLEGGGYKTCYYDKSAQQLWIGGVDKCIIVNIEECMSNNQRINPASIVSDIYINNPIISSSQNNRVSDKLNVDLAYCNNIHLKYNENSIYFRVSTGILSKDVEVQTGYFYRMRELGEHWKNISSQKSIIEYPYMNPGTYYFELGRLDESSNDIQVIRRICIRIDAPWYQTLWFRLMLGLIALSILMFIINYYRLRVKLHISEMERKKTLALTQQKIEFINSNSDTPLKLHLSQETINTENPVAQLSSADKSILDSINEIIEKHIEDSDLNVKKLASLSGMNEKQIYRKLKQITGRTAVDYIRSIRLKRAALLLSQKVFTVNEVMYMSGFSSSSYFAKCFYDEYQKLPKNYMDEYLADNQ